MFKNMGGNIPAGNFLGGNFPGGNFPDTIYSLTMKLSGFQKISIF